MKYEILIGCDYAGKRAEPGDIVEDIPARSVAWLLRIGAIERQEEPVLKPAAPKRSRKGASK